MISRYAVALLALASWTSALEAQSGRSYIAFRQWRSEDSLTAQIHFADGSLRIGLSQPEELYRAELMYSPRVFSPTSRYDSASHLLSIGFPKLENDRAGFSVEVDGGKFKLGGGNRKRKRARSSATLALSPNLDVPMTLVLADADVTFDRVRIPALKITAGPGPTTIRFAEPNGIVCRQLSVGGVGARVSLLGLGNSRCQEIRFQSGVGEAVLDFSGAWQGNAEVRATIVAGQLKLWLPPQLGVQIRENGLLAELDVQGFTKEEDRYRSANYATAERRLDIDLSAVIGSVTVEWLGE